MEGIFFERVWYKKDDPLTVKLNQTDAVIFPLIAVNFLN